MIINGNFLNNIIFNNWLFNWLIDLIIDVRNSKKLHIFQENVCFYNYVLIGKILHFISKVNLVNR